VEGTWCESHIMASAVCISNPSNGIHNHRNCRPGWRTCSRWESSGILKITIYPDIYPDLTPGGSQIPPAAHRFTHALARSTNSPGHTGKAQVRSTTNDAAPLTVLHIALVRDCLLEDGSATLHEACNRPQWTVRLADRFVGYFFPKKLKMLHPTWKLNATGSDCQMTISSLKQYFSLHGNSKMS
jgi:hypothetical protein